MSLNKKFRTFVFSNILLGAMAFNNWANNSIYKDDISDVSYSCNYMDWSTRVTYKLNGEEKSLENPSFSKMQSFFKSDNDFKDFLLGLGGSETYNILFHNIEYFKNWVSKRDDREELVVCLLSAKCDEMGEWLVAGNLYETEHDDFVDMLRSKDFTLEQKQEINELVGQDVFVRQ